MLTYNYRVVQKMWHLFVRLKFIKYQPIYEIVSLLKSDENL